MTNPPPRLPPLVLFPSETRTKAKALEFLGTKCEEKQKARLALSEVVEECALSCSIVWVLEMVEMAIAMTMARVRA